MNNPYTEDLKKLARFVYSHPEPGFSEVESSNAQIEYLKSQGFAVETDLCHTHTGYRASYGSGHPVIALLGEFDALYGLGQKPDVPEPCPDGKPMGHGCGHHMLGTAVIGAGLLIRDYLKEKGIPGTVQIYGCPGEEAGSGKAYMARDGAFDGVDLAFSYHPSVFHQVCTGSSQSCISASFRFHGVAAHAAGEPQNGRSALDAVELMDVGANYLREHMESTDRIHYAITNTGGSSPNVVQAEAEVKYLIRSTNNRKCLALYDRVKKIAQGAALMTETSVDILFDEGLSNTIVNFTLEDVLADAFRKAGAPVYTKEDLAYAKKFYDTWKEPYTLDQIPYPVKDKQKLLESEKTSVIDDYFVETIHSDRCEMGSTDVGDVSYVVPTATLNTACYSYGANAHSWQWVAEGASEIAMKGMLKGSEVLALAAESLYEHPETVEAAKKEFAERIKDDPYQCLIPKDVMPHQILM